MIGTRYLMRMHPSRHLVNPWHLNEGDVDIEDIAHHLSCANRYHGGYPWPMSIGQHSLNVEKWLRWSGYNAEICLYGLVHDATEAYVNDLSKPLKIQPFMWFYRRAEARAEKAIFRALELSGPLPKVVHQADRAVYELERMYAAGILVAEHSIFRMAEAPWHQIRKEFLERYWELEAERRMS